MQYQSNAARLPGRRIVVEAAGQLIHLFRDGPDYAFILRTGCGACYPRQQCPWILVPTRGAVAHRQSVYESLQGRSEVGPLPTPRRCHSGSGISRCTGAGFADVSPVFTLPLRAEATILLIEPASENATQSGLHA